MDGRLDKLRLEEVTHHCSAAIRCMHGFRHLLPILQTFAPKAFMSPEVGPLDIARRGFHVCAWVRKLLSSAAFSSSLTVALRQRQSQSVKWVSSCNVTHWRKLGAKFGGDEKNFFAVPPK